MNLKEFEMACEGKVLNYMLGASERRQNRYKNMSKSQKMLYKKGKKIAKTVADTTIGLPASLFGGAIGLAGGAVGLASTPLAAILSKAGIVHRKNLIGIADNSGKIISQIKYYDYSKENFDWILIADVETKEEYRGKGLATKIVKIACNELSKKYPNKGLYLLVKKNNIPAIRVYKNNQFKILKEYKMKDGVYYIMYKGNADTEQLANMNFR